MRISHATRAGLVAVWLLAASAAVAGCTTTVNGAAVCPGCGGSGAEFPPPTGLPGPPAGAEVLPPNTAGYVYIETKSGATRCQISADTVGCESQFTDSPVIDGENATGVEVSASGDNRWVVGNLGAMPTTTIDYAVYDAVGWIIEADSDGTRFTNNVTGHGMYVSIDQVEFF